MKKLLSLFLVFVMCAAQMTAASADEAILKNVVLHGFDFSGEEQTTTDEAVLNLPVLSGGAEYSADNENVRFNAKSSEARVSLNLENPVTAEDEEGIINVEFDMNFGSMSGQSIKYSIASANGEKIVDFCFEPYKDTGTAYIKVGGNDVVFDVTDDEGNITQTVNRQIKDCISSKTGDGMGAAVTHFQNEINLMSG